MSDGKFRGEDESAGVAHPALDLAAGLFLLVLGVWFAVEALRLPVPGGVMTAPGLLPFLTGASLAVMALILGLSGFRRFGTEPAFRFAVLLGDLESQRRTVLIVTVVLYVAALDFFSFETYLAFAGVQIPIGSFEPITIVSLTTMLRTFWTPRLMNCVAVAVIWTACLSLAFRWLFNIPMPG